MWEQELMGKLKTWQLLKEQFNQNTREKPVRFLLLQYFVSWPTAYMRIFFFFFNSYSKFPSSLEVLKEQFTQKAINKSFSTYPWWSLSIDSFCEIEQGFMSVNTSGLEGSHWAQTKIILRVENLPSITMNGWVGGYSSQQISSPLRDVSLLFYLTSLKTTSSNNIL